MRTIEKIKAEIAESKPCNENYKTKLCSKRDCEEHIHECRAGYRNYVETLNNELLNAITSNIPLPELETICKAYKDGRAVVMPCKVGDTVYKLCPVNLDIPFGSMWDGRIVSKNCHRCPYANCACGDIILGLTSITVIENISESWIYKYREYFGKTVFLTLDEAQAKLNEMDGGK